jgi:RNA methyltransferase, TrmH family
MITSTQNKRVVQAARLKKRAMRENDELFLVEGVQGVVEALGSKGLIQEIFHTGDVSDVEQRLQAVLRSAERQGVPVRPVSVEVMSHLTSTVTPQGVVAVARFVDVPLQEAIVGAACIPVLVEVRDPGNAGTILRSADASGADAVVFTRSSVDVYNQKTVRATAGSLFHVPVVREVDAAKAATELRASGFAVLAAAAEGDDSLYDVNLSRPTAVLFGNESKGLPDEAVAMADRSVRVPISGRAESLNLAAAATLVLFEAARQRSGGERDVLAQIVAGAAHDIRSPLTAMKGFGSTLASKWDRLDEEQRRMMLDGIVHDANRMEVVVSQLVDAARIRSGRLELGLVPTDLLDVAREVGAGIGPWAPAEVALFGEPAMALVDRQRLRLMLFALIEGAQWFGEEGPVRIETRRGDRPSVRVFRAVTQLDRERAEALFRPRAPGTGGGSKVGLFLAKGLAEAQGGTLDVDTEGGLAFTLTLQPA